MLMAAVIILDLVKNPDPYLTNFNLKWIQSALGKKKKKNAAAQSFRTPRISLPTVCQCYLTQSPNVNTKHVKFHVESKVNKP